jgi:hypothetical protein
LITVTSLLIVIYIANGSLKPGLSTPLPLDLEIYGESGFQDKLSEFQDTTHFNTTSPYYPKTEEERQARIDWFKLNHEQIVRTPEKRVKFCYVVPSENGYGNKLISVVNAFAVALLTNSAVIINMTEIHLYIREPLHQCFQESRLVNNELSYLYEPSSVYMMPVVTTKVAYQAKKNLSQVYLSIPGGHDRYAFKGGGLSLYYELACNRNYFSTFLFYGLVKPGTIERARAVLDSPEFNKTSTDEMVNTMYRVGFELAHGILQVFWQPVISIQREVDDFVDRYFKGNFVIGMQFRNEFLHRKDIELFFQCAKSIHASSRMYGRKPVKWFQFFFL